MQLRQVCDREKNFIIFDVDNAISGVDVKFAGWDYSSMLPRVCSLFTCHIETIKKLTNYEKHGMYSVYYLTSKRTGENSTKLNGPAKLLKHQHRVGQLATHCKMLKLGLSERKYTFFYSAVYQTSIPRSLCLSIQSANDKKVNLRRYSGSMPACLSRFRGKTFE